MVIRRGRGWLISGACNEKARPLSRGKKAAELYEEVVNRD
jgi:hypothetical protein